MRGLFAVHVESWRACDLAVDRRAAGREEIDELGDRVLTGAGEVQEVEACWALSLGGLPLSLPLARAIAIP